MAINTVNIDTMLGMQRDFLIGGRTFTVHFNDQLQKDITTAQMRVSDLMDQIEKTPEEKQKELEEAPLPEKISFVEEQIDKIREIAIDVFTKLFSKEDAEWIYSHYNQSTQALVAILGIIYNESLDVVQKNNVKKQQKYPTKFNKKNRK